MKLSNRALNTPESAIRKLVPLAEKTISKGIKIYHLNIGQPDIKTPAKIIKKIHKFDQKIISYAPSRGLDRTIKGWQRFYLDKNVKFESQEIIVTSGGSEGLIFAFMAIADPGDEILVFEPFYTSYSIIASMSSVKLKAVRTYVETGFHLPDKEKIESAITRKTKAMLICNPNNPTGTLYSKKEIEMLIDIAKKKNLFIISDDTYQEIIFDNKKIYPFTKYKDIQDRLIVVDSVSKRFNSCGLRVGCIASKNKRVLDSILKFAQGRLSVATVDQLAVVSMLEHHRTYVGNLREVYQKRKDVVMEGLKRIKAVSAVSPSGAFYIMPRLPIDDSEQFAKFLLEDFSYKRETVMIAPATGFYQTAGLGKKEIRIAYVLSRKRLKKAMKLLKMAIEVYNNK